MDAERVHEKLEELIRTRRQAWQDRQQHLTPHMSAHEIAELSLGKEIGRGGFAIVQEAIGSDGALLAIKRYPLNENGRNVGLLKRATEREETLDLIARAITIGDDANLQRLRDSFVLLNRYRTNLRGYLTEIANIEPLERGRRILEAFISAGTGLAQLHAAGYKHRDVKPDNLLIDDTDGQIRAHWADFDIVGLQPGMRSEHLTTLLDYQGILLGTRAYLSPPLLLGNVTMKSAEDKIQDNWAFGVMLGEAVVPEVSLSEEKLSLTATIINARKNLRRHPELASRSHEIGLPGLERVIVRATDAARGYASMEEFVDDLQKIGHGSRSSVVRKLNNRIAWEYRVDEREGDRYIRRMRMSNIAKITCVIGATAWASIAGVRGFLDRKHATAYEQSTEGVARVAADLNPAHVRAFIETREKEFFQELEDIHKPVFESGTEQIFPEGIFPQVTIPQAYGTSGDFSSGYWLELLLSWWEATGNQEHLSEYRRYVQRLDISLNSTGESDRNRQSVGRYHALMRAMRDLPEQVRNTTIPQKKMEEAHVASALGVSLYMKKLEEENIFMGSDVWLLPLVIDTIQSRDREEIIQRINREDPQANMTLHGLYDLLSDSGVRMCALFLDENGKSFWRTENKEGNRRDRTTPNEPVAGFKGPVSEQPTTAQIQMWILQAMQHRVLALEQLLDTTGNERSRIATEITNDDIYFGKKERDLQSLRQCAARAQTYLESQVRENGLLPEYLISADATIGIPIEMHANALWLQYLRESGQYEKRDRLLSSIFAHAEMGKVPKSRKDPPRTAFGLFQQTRAYHPIRIGPMYDTESIFLSEITKFLEKGEEK